MTPEERIAALDRLILSANDRAELRYLRHRRRQLVSLQRQQKRLARRAAR